METRSISLELEQKNTNYLRAISILAVIAGHILGGRFGIIHVNTTSLLGDSGVNIFLFLSGYGLYCSYKTKGITAKAFWSNKIRKIFLPYAAITVCYYAFLVVTHNSPGLIALLENILFIDYTRKIDATMWYMSFLLLWYVIFFFVFYFDYSDIAKILMLFLFAAVFRRRWLQDVFANCAWQFSDKAYAFPIGVTIGFFMKKASILPEGFLKFAKSRYVRILLVAVCLALFVAGLAGYVTLSYTQKGLLLFVMLYIAFASIRFDIPFLGWCGKNSFLIYLLEGKWISIMALYPLFNNNLFLYCIVYTAGMMLSIFAYQYAKKWLSIISAKLDA